MVGNLIVSKVKNKYVTKGKEYEVLDYDLESGAVLIPLDNGFTGWLLETAYTLKESIN